MEQGFSICYIAKNEEKNIEKSISKIKELFGQGKGIIYEILVLDTGSTDNTVNMAESLGARVCHFEWIKDFAAARNEAMRLARYDRILFIDADEIPEKLNLKEFVDLWNKYPSGVGRLERRNLCNSTENGTCIYIDRVERFFDRRHYRYEGRIHEQICRNDGKKMMGYPLPLTVYHEGYFGSRQQLKEKAERNNDLLFIELSEHPDDPYICFQIAQSYDLMNDIDNAVKYYEKGYKLNPDRAAVYVANLVCSYGKELSGLGRYDDARKLIENEMKYYESFADFLCFAGFTYTKTMELEQAIESYKKALVSSEFALEGSNSFLPAYNLGCIYEGLGDELRAKDFFEIASRNGYEKAAERLKGLLDSDYDRKSQEKFISIIIKVDDDTNRKNLGSLWMCLREQSIGIGHLEIVFVVMTEREDLVTVLHNAEKEYESSVCLFFPEPGVQIEKCLSEAMGYTSADYVMLLDCEQCIKWDALRMMRAAFVRNEVDMVTYGIDYSDSDFILTIENEQMREAVRDAGILKNAPIGSLYNVDFLLRNGVTASQLINGDVGVEYVDRMYCIKESLKLSE